MSQPNYTASMEEAKDQYEKEKALYEEKFEDTFLTFNEWLEETALVN